MRYYIYVYYQQGNIGSHQVKVLDNGYQPNDGFETEPEAEAHLLNLIEKKKGIYFERNWYKFTILKTYQSKSAV